MVGPDLALVFRAFDEVSPFLQGSDNGKHLLVVDLIVPFNWGERFREEGDRVPLFVFCRYL